MKRPVTLAIMVACAVPFLTLISTETEAKKSGGSTSVRGHVTKKGTYVQPHRRTNPDGSKTNNWSSKGNMNPYTGKKGTVDPYRPRPPGK